MRWARHWRCQRSHLWGETIKEIIPPTQKHSSLHNQRGSSSQNAVFKTRNEKFNSYYLPPLTIIKVEYRILFIVIVLYDSHVHLCLTKHARLQLLRYPLGVSILHNYMNIHCPRSLSASTQYAYCCRACVASVLFLRLFVAFLFLQQHAKYFRPPQKLQARKKYIGDQKGDHNKTGMCFPRL